MPVSRDYLEYLEEQLAPLGGISSRRMFGGAGVYKDRLMFGLVADDKLYLKTDDAARPLFEAEGLTPFIYQAPGKDPMPMSYWEAPDACLDDQELLLKWAAVGFEAALRAARKKKPKKKRSAKTK